MKIVETKDITTIRPLYDAWLAIANGEEFGLDLDPVVADTNAQTIIESGGSLLVAYDEDDSPVGFFALSPMPSAFGRQLLAVETMWFALPNAQKAGLALLKEARLWAEENGCSHLMISGSRLASDLHDKVCSFCERIGAKQFETVYLMETN